MKNVLLAIDDNNFSEGAFEFARNMNDQEPILLSGIFLPELDLSTNLNYTSVFVPLIETYAEDSIKQSREKFKQSCLRYGITFNIHDNLQGKALSELKKATRFSDLLLLGGEKFYADLTQYNSEEFLGGALHKAECPVIVVPEKFTPPESVILCYDGGPSCLYAIKSFTYLFPQLCNRRTILVYSTVQETEIPEFDKIKELATHHFTDLSFQLLQADPEKYFDTWLSEIKYPIVVSGAYARSGLSRLARKSFISSIIKEHHLPLYIAHF